ncbi:hypothetical protein NC653_011522 [Populus alba x Populus x berolinensis]|uniref:Uncharacterized protein n=1 Tax=Populus alba x Populus x berolinensis TaxID=444605 RepID=A0AAD6R2H3_9ROSI|nr:hypothetical protein NC653_011522 [Populus alba x Populus x berolinensis]
MSLLYHLNTGYGQRGPNPKVV